jgi:hypothetical protein
LPDTAITCGVLPPAKLRAREIMLNRVFQIVGKKSITPSGVVQYPVRDQLTGEFLTLALEIEDSDALVPGVFLCHDTGSGNNVACLPDNMIKHARLLGFQDFTLRFGKVLKVFPRKESDPIRFSVAYRGNDNELITTSVQMSHWKSREGTFVTKHPQIVDGRIMVLALSAADLSVAMGGWPIEFDI